MDGISHLVTKDLAPSLETFREIKAKFYPESPYDQSCSGSAVRENTDTAGQSGMDSLGNFPAFGVMFIDTKSGMLTPVVHVREVDTTYFEGSCASGTTAAAFATAMDLPDGFHRMAFKQPAGTLYADIKKESDEITEIQLSGRVELSDVITVEI